MSANAPNSKVRNLLLHLLTQSALLLPNTPKPQPYSMSKSHGPIFGPALKLFANFYGHKRANEKGSYGVT